MPKILSKWKKCKYVRGLLYDLQIVKYFILHFEREMGVWRKKFKVIEIGMYYLDFVTDICDIIYKNIFIS